MLISTIIHWKIKLVLDRLFRHTSFSTFFTMKELKLTDSFLS